MNTEFKKISIIIVNYNSKDLLKQCLLNLDDIYPNYEIIVVDNASTDGSATLVAQEFKHVILCANNENLGLSKAHNQAYSYASGEFLLYLGTDAFPTKETMIGMMDYMLMNPKVGIVTPKLVLRDGSVDMDAHRGFPTPWSSLCHFAGLGRLIPHSNLFNYYFLGGADMSQPHEIDLCISHFMLVRREVLYDIESWDEDFFVFGEDVDFCYRTKQKGWKIFYLPNLSATHYKGSSVGIRNQTADISPASAETKLNMTKHTTRAMELFYKKHMWSKYPLLISFFVLGGIKLQTFLRVRSLKKKIDMKSKN